MGWMDGWMDELKQKTLYQAREVVEIAWPVDTHLE